MKTKLNKITSFLLPFKKEIGLYFIFNLISILFNLISLAMVIPFLRILFNIEKVNTTKNINFSFSNALDFFNYKLSLFIENENKAKALFYLCLFVTIVFLLKNLFAYLANYILAPIRTGVTKNLRQSIFNSILNVKMKHFNDERKGDIISKLSDDVKEVEHSIIATLLLFFKEPFHLLIFITALLYMSPMLTLFVFAFIPIGGIVIGKLSQYLKKSAHQTQTKLGNVLSVVEETLSGISVIKAFNAQTYIKQNFNAEVEDMKEINTKMLRLKDLASPSSEVIAIILVTVVLWFGGNLVLANEGSLQAETFIAFIVIFSQIIPPAKSLANAYSNLHKGLASLNRVESVLNLEKENSQGIEINSFKDKIEFKDVVFSYASEISTIAKLLLKFYAAYKGSILLDGEEYNKLKNKNVRSLISYVGQNAILFNDSIYNNIVFGLDHISQNQVIEACKIARIHSFIQALPNAYQTNVGESGNKLSGGEKQRITIARALLRNSEILILDEATSALDSENESLIKEALEKLMHNKTVLVIAHRLSTIQSADEILVLKNGTIIERGNHKALLNSKNSNYKKFVDLQKV